jgi:hypothetical protein
MKTMKIEIYQCTQLTTPWLEIIPAVLRPFVHPVLLKPGVQIRPDESIRPVVGPGLGDPLLAAQVFQLSRRHTEEFGGLLQ